MPTKKKRVGFIPRENVMKIIDKLSYANNLSNSKIISLLVEESLSMRGLLNIESGKEKNESLESNLNNQIFTNNINKSKLDNFDSSNNSLISQQIFKLQTNQEHFNLKTYEKFILFLKFQEMVNKYEK